MNNNNNNNNSNKDNLNLNLLNGGTPLIKKKKRSPQKKKTSLSKEYKVFLKKSLTKDNSKPNVVKPIVVKSIDVKPNVVKSNDVKPNVVKSNDVKPNVVKSNDVKPNVVKSNDVKPLGKKYVKIVKVNKNNGDNFVKIMNTKDIHKSKNKFTKKSQEKKNKRNSKKKKIHRKITKVKRLSFKCNDNKLDVKKLIKETQDKSNQEIKAALKEKGIDIKSNKNKLLKDLYLFTSCNNINIVRE